LSQITASRDSLADILAAWVLVFRSSNKSSYLSIDSAGLFTTYPADIVAPENQEIRFLGSHGARPFVSKQGADAPIEQPG
jgi:hypothetical protein